MNQRFWDSVYNYLTTELSATPPLSPVSEVHIESGQLTLTNGKTIRFCWPGNPSAPIEEAPPIAEISDAEFTFLLEGGAKDEQIYPR